ncbi:putative deoxyribonucleotide triphosphate pyrophosphatase [Parvularcula bermudensis HTCC2503]|uniref:dITP/XTP pyrophosphatase n=1 Tax=Parvularcula bermudensis (strain ATCC BAA-594 / HTCC2503 / KCTC 12087) TaxID=314260 RepID=E0TD12_PARBH|nr:RdgB/HAM1 family non-canonical purine NTP pyrophosphatase [Parvularcula bermudensis]ADM08671.1 putative deoxyribonucleotide triphosphate pyrophosphatase [Parvularcula bermudensis HTCC2503]
MTVINVLRARGLLLATHNQGKVREFSAWLAPYAISISSAADHDLPEPEETATDFLGNATLKAEAAMAATGLPALADDSGLAVAALGGAPGLYSARWAGPDRDYQRAFDRIAAELGGAQAMEGAAAAFVCVLVLTLPGDTPLVAEGQVEGTLTASPRGAAGFGYDPIFRPEGEARTFAEMTMAEKAQFSHRARAMTNLAQVINVPAP